MPIGRDDHGGQMPLPRQRTNQEMVASRKEMKGGCECGIALQLHLFCVSFYRFIGDGLHPRTGHRGQGWAGAGQGLTEWTEEGGERRCAPEICTSGTTGDFPQALRKSEDLS